MAANVVLFLLNEIKEIDPSRCGCFECRPTVCYSVVAC